MHAYQNSYVRTSSYYVKMDKVVERLDVITLVLQRFQWTVQSRLQRKAFQSILLKVPYVRASQQPLPNFGQRVKLRFLISTLLDGH